MARFSVERFVDLACTLPDRPWVLLDDLRDLYHFEFGHLPAEERLYAEDVVRELPPRHLHLLSIVSPAVARFVEQEVLQWPFYADFIRNLTEGDDHSLLEVSRQREVLGNLCLSPTEWTDFITRMFSTERPTASVGSPLVHLGRRYGSRSLTPARPPARRPAPGGAEQQPEDSVPWLYRRPPGGSGP